MARSNPFPGSRIKKIDYARARALLAEIDGKCKVCDTPITSAELCAPCAEGNDPFPPTAKHNPK